MSPPVEAVVDASLLFSLLDAVFDWALVHADLRIDVGVDLKNRPPRAQLLCRFASQPADPATNDAPLSPSAGTDSTTWRLIEQTALTMESPLHRDNAGGSALLAIEFPRTVDDDPQAVGTFKPDQGFAPSNNARPLAGSLVLVIA